MRRFTNLLLTVALAATSAAQSQPATAAPQTARQALLEMFFSKTPGTFAKHLPAATLNALQKSSAFASLQAYSMLASQLQTQGGSFETFETGRILVAANDPQSGKKFEMIVENDSLRGEEDEIEVSFLTYKEQQVQRAPFLPRMMFVMKSEAGVWKLNEISITVRLPLADPDFLKGIEEGIKASAAKAAPNGIPATPNNLGNDAAVATAMRSILNAENTYSNTYRAVGFTCILADLDGFGGAEANEHQAMLISSGLASGRKFGYTFTLSGCGGSPATSFHLSAAPAGANNFGKRAYCADQSGALRYSSDGNPATCFASGLPAQ